MRILLNTAIFLLISAIFFCQPGFSQSPSPEKLKNTDDVRDPQTRALEEEIILINFLNSLNLRKEQLEFIIRQASEIEETRREVYAEFSRFAGDMRRVERKIKQQVESGKLVVAEQDLVQYRKLNKKSHLLFYRLNDKIKEAIKAVEGKLEDFQLIALDKYFPAIIPMLEGRFIGGNDLSLCLGQILSFSRKIPEKDYEKQKKDFVDKWTALISADLSPNKKLGEKELVKKEFLKSMEKARMMDDVDFSLHMRDLAVDLGPKVTLEVPGKSRQEKIQKFLLSKQSIPVLQKRLKGK
jgi:hypothetical protein